MHEIWKPMNMQILSQQAYLRPLRRGKTTLETKHLNKNIKEEQK